MLNTARLNRSDREAHTLRSLTLVGAASLALALLVPATAVAQTRLGPGSPSIQQPAPRPDFPGAKQSESSTQSEEMSKDTAQSPRPDFPGAKQGEGSPQK
jgi:hypothetical protein